MTRIPSRIAVVTLGSLTLVCAACAHHSHRGDFRHGAADGDLFACVALFDVQRANLDLFQRELLASSRERSAEPGFVAERILRNIDPLSNSFALYSRVSSLELAERRCRSDMRKLQHLLERPPEVHVARVSAAYTGKGKITDPDGREFGVGRVGQIAHLGLFLPFDEHRQEYDRILDLIKQNTVDRNNEGFIGEEVLDEVVPRSVEAQNPYTPRPVELVPMSINYGEFATVENAENAYVQRAEDSTGNPRFRYWNRAFFAALQVPCRFYIFRVVGNFPEDARLADHALDTQSAPQVGVR